MENEEKKTYTVIGKVEIGTDEYRDLIENLSKANAEISELNSKWYTEYSRTCNAEKKLKETTAKYLELKDFVESDEAISTKLKLYKLEKMNVMEG